MTVEQSLISSVEEASKMTTTEGGDTSNKLPAAATDVAACAAATADTILAAHRDAAAVAAAATSSAVAGAGPSEQSVVSDPWRSRIVFLDIDGVLNRTRDAKHVRLDEDLVARQRDFVKSADTGIVLSTYWRAFTDYIRFILSRYKIPQERVIDRTPGRGHLGWRASDDKAYESRSHEIIEWLSQHPEVESFVILDDREAAGLGVLAPHFVHVKTEVGLTEADVRAAHKALKVPRPHDI
eukprot:CAMPEP_0206600728 /NCGR_PEP_ID=MMETSP0325_2-20121206/46029_1 /ASSEMBLY_ACC=CAM_ASM_000347 /TAXON_ID=2866 /ORGANISM="Crypthecodinium cohnii, Strain Seligo" /LENGTH=238 /DNA_ID=CAMNT_0054112209 /DNA_START=124 /DNA_END=839 /DNA_ORIENTATION=+